jgi:hypothetical protein
MTTALPTPAPPALVAEALPHIAICTSCPHPQDAHDAIAARYCAASHDTAITRGCICR